MNYMFDWDLDGKVRPVVTDKFELEHGNESKLLAHSDSSDSYNSEARIKTTDFLFENYCENFCFSIENLLEENKPLVIEKYEIEYRQS